MLKLSLKTVLARKRRAVLTAFSIVIGIAFLAGTFVFVCCQVGMDPLGKIAVDFLEAFRRLECVRLSWL